MDQQQIEARMLSGEPFTYAELCVWRGRAEGNPKWPDSDRRIDRTIQKLRRKGLISFRREGGRVVWSKI